MVIQDRASRIADDWCDTHAQIFSADTRYNVLTDDGANIFLRTSGPAQKNGDLHLRVVFETGDKQYYWLNNVVGESEIVPCISCCWRWRSSEGKRADGWAGGS